MSDSLKAKIQAARTRSVNHRTHDWPIPGTDNTMWGTFRALDDWAQVSGISKAAIKAAGDEPTQELYIAADNLISACTDVFGYDDQNVKHSIAPGLTVDLAHELFDGVSETPRQAVFEIFPNTKSVAVFFAEIEQWFSTAHDEVDTELAKN